MGKWAISVALRALVRAGSAGLRVGHDALPRVKQGRQTAR
jgi:hypothetical protein